MSKYLDPSGGDDTDRIKEALATLSRGGWLELGEGEFQLSEKIDVYTPGLKIRGQGGTQPILDGSTPPTRLNWTGAVGTQAMFAFINMPGGGLQDLTINGGQVDASGKTVKALNGGYVLYGAIWGRFDVHLCNLSDAGVVCVASPTANSMHNWITGSCYECPKGGVMNGNGTFNACHNLVERFDHQRGTEYGWELRDCDNNTFVHCLTPGYLIPEVPGVKYGFYLSDPNLARGNYFYHLQAGSRANDPQRDGASFYIGNSKNAVLKDPGNVSHVYGFDQTNGEGFFKTDGDPYTKFVHLYN